VGAGPRGADARRATPPVLRGPVARFDAFGARASWRVNDYDLGLAKARGEHVRHSYDDTDEVFLALQ
jgi:hypothetical protein